jgi:hypothetical protein
MTAITVDAPRRTVTPSRIWRVARLNVTNPMTTLILPWVFLVAILAMNIAIWALITYAAGGPEGLSENPFVWNGALSFVFIYLGIAAIQTMSITFPFALGYGVTRRHFYLGSALTFVLLAIGYTIGLTILSAIERATNGWGLRGWMFNAAFFAGGEPWYIQSWVYFCTLMFSLFLGAAFAGVWVRWKAFGLTTAFIVLAFAIVALIAVLTFGELWPQFWEAIADLGFAGVASWSLVVTAVIAVLGYLLLQRATPKS